MRETGVIFEDWSVRAIACDWKLQTRRIMKVQPEVARDGMVRWPGNGGYFAPHVAIAAIERGGYSWRYGRPGDHIRVKESWRTEERRSDMVDGIRFRADDAFVPIANTAGDAQRWVVAHDNGKHRAAWRSSMFLPRWASRLFLEITEVRVQRLGDITEEDAKAEGVDPVIPGHGPVHRDAFYAEGGYHNAAGPTAWRDGYTHAWNDLHGWGNGVDTAWHRMCGVWVWAITFKRIA
jgi:hypothetical protein